MDRKEIPETYMDFCVTNGGGVRDTDEVILQKIPVFTKHVFQPMDQARIRITKKTYP
jgi:hypothetical protein